MDVKYGPLQIRILVFENKILRKIYGPMFDSELNIWHRGTNIEPR